MSVADLLRTAAARCLAELREAGRVPQGETYEFPAGEGAGRQGVLKTCVRQVFSVRYGRFRAHEVVQRGPDGQGGIRSLELGSVVPWHANYAFDVVAAVGWASSVEGRRLREVQQELREGDAGLEVPLSTLYDLKLRFLFCLEAMHQGARGVLREYLQQRGGYTALIDGTCDGGSPVLLGVTEAEEEMVLGSWKAASESAAAVEACLRAVKEGFGTPTRGLHDMSKAITEAWAAVFADTRDDICHFHFGHDVGRDLCEAWQKALAKGMREHKLQLRLHEQRKVQTRRLDEAIAAGGTPALAERLLAHEQIDPKEMATLGRAVIVVAHQWILDYASDGQGRGFPFDPRVLYLHRRIVQAESALRKLLPQLQGQTEVPPALPHLWEKLHAYVVDGAVVKAAAGYEEAWGLFNRLRTVLRLEASGKIAPLSDPYAHSAAESREVADGLKTFANQLRAELADEGDPQRARMVRLVVQHLDDYAPYLQGMPTGGDGTWERTTNKKERQWRQMRRALRRVHGRSHVGRDLEKQPDAVGLVLNLTNPSYIALVLGKVENLPDKLAAAAAAAGSFSTWKAKQDPLHTGRLPIRELRTEDLLDEVTDSYTAALLGAAYAAAP